MKQLETKKKQDWASQVLRDLESLNINNSLNEIQGMSKEKFHKIVKIKTEQVAFEDLENIKSGKKKVKSNKFCQLKISSFLLPNDDISPDFAKFMVKAVTRMIEGVKCNFKKNHKEDLNCKSCFINGILNKCTQKHFMDCRGLIGKNELVTYLPTYEDLFEDNVGDKAYICRILKENLKLKKLIENEM